MGIALLTLVDLLAPLQSLACRWIPKKQIGATDCSAGLRYVAVRPASMDRSAMAPGEADVATPRPAVAASAVKSKATSRPLRVVRTVDAHSKGSKTGRVVLSGRLIDVCAELDRLAALEASEISHVTRVLH